MTNKEILQKAIEKAIANGLEFGTEPYTSEEIQYKVYYEIIFSHDFAKAFWGSREFESYGIDKELDSAPQVGCMNADEVNFCGAIWEYHLQQMVLEDAPIKYLEKFL
jgi:hypothetical protein